MPATKKVSKTCISIELSDLFEKIDGIVFQAIELDCADEAEKLLLDVQGIVQQIIGLAHRIPQDYYNLREFSVYMIDASNRLSEQIGGLDFYSEGNEYQRVKLSCKYIAGFAREHKKPFSRFCSEFEYESSLIGGEMEPELMFPSDPSKLEAWDRDTEKMRRVKTKMDEHPEWKTEKNWKSSKIAKAIELDTKKKTKLSQTDVSRYISRILKDELEGRLSELASRKSDNPLVKGESYATNMP